MRIVGETPRRKHRVADLENRTRRLSAESVAPMTTSVADDHPVLKTIFGHFIDDRTSIRRGHPPLRRQSSGYRREGVATQRYRRGSRTTVDIQQGGSSNSSNADVNRRSSVKPVDRWTESNSIRTASSNFSFRFFGDAENRSKRARVRRRFGIR